jgi:hypothetical protein
MLMPKSLIFFKKKINIGILKILIRLTKNSNGGLRLKLSEKLIL